MIQRNVFVSHAHADNAMCEQIATALRQQGIDVWIDLHDAQKGVDLSDDITRQLERRSIFVLLVTAASNTSRWVSMELSNYIALYNDKESYLVNGAERMILPVLLEPVPIPTRLRGFNWIDGVNKPTAEIAGEIAKASNVPFSLASHTFAIPPLPTQQFPLPSSLMHLGFKGYVANRIGCIIPPICDIPAGSFIMGSDKHYDSHAKSNEVPRYQIPTLQFQIGKYPVTVAEYVYAIKAGVVTDPQKSGGVNWQTQLQRLDHPVVCINWFEARAYCIWLAQITQQPWHLPTEAEWEKAARGTDKRIYPWGDQWDSRRANTSSSGPGMTTSVGNYDDASPYGVHDMTGNVWEWTSSIYQNRPPYQNASIGIDRDTTSARVLRGGSWDLSPTVARVAFRNSSPPDLSSRNFGFRLALGLPSDVE